MRESGGQVWRAKKQPHTMWRLTGSRTRIQCSWTCRYQTVPSVLSCVTSLTRRRRRRHGTPLVVISGPRRPIRGRVVCSREVRDIARITHLSCAYSTPTKLSEGLPLTAPLTYSFIPARTQTTWALFATPETPLKTCDKKPGSAPMDTRTLAPGAHWAYT